MIGYILKLYTVDLLFSDSNTDSPFTTAISNFIQ